MKMDNEYDKIMDILADEREKMDYEDFIDEKGNDWLSSCIGSPLETLVVLVRKLHKLEEENKNLRGELDYVYSLLD